MAWAKPHYTKGRIDWAGEVLSSLVEPDLADYLEAIAIVNNWRAIHSYPLQAMKMTLKHRAKSVCASAIVAQRLKRLASIQLKLAFSRQDGHHPQLSQMQDIGGCRAIMDTVAQVHKLTELFADASKKNPHRGPQYSKTFDYIASPKTSGYRSIHLVYRFRSDSAEHSCYNGQRIEIQLRSRLQHYWATAVETYSTFTGEALKSNVGSDQWKRFFSLVSSTIAISEKCPTVPGTPKVMKEVVPELRDLYNSLNVHKILTGWSAATKYTKEEQSTDIQNAAMYLLVLNYDKFAVTVYPFKKEHLADANAHYALIEKDHPELQAVLVSVDSVAALRAAYPNYFLDTNSFVGWVQKAIK